MLESGPFKSRAIQSFTSSIVTRRQESPDFTQRNERIDASLSLQVHSWNATVSKVHSRYRILHLPQRQMAGCYCELDGKIWLMHQRFHQMKFSHRFCALP